MLVFFVMWCVGSGLCDGLITSSEESYQMCVCVCVCVFVIWEPQQLGGLFPHLGLFLHTKKLILWFTHHQLDGT